MSKSPERVLVTGGDGFIGRYVVALLRNFGIQACAFDRTLENDILDTNEVNHFVKWADAVIHLAGVLGTSELFAQAHVAVDVNVHGTLNVLEAMRGTGKHLVLIDQPHIWFNVYEATHLAAARMAQAFCRDFDVPLDVVCAYNAYGPGQKVEGRGHPRKIIPTFSVNAWSGRPIIITGDGSQVVDLIYAGDIAHAFLMALIRGGGIGHTHHAGTGEPMSVGTVAEYVRRTVSRHGGPKVPIIYTERRKGENVETDWEDCVAPMGMPYRLEWPLIAATVDSYRQIAPSTAPAPEEP